MDRPRPPFTTWVRATEFRPFPEFLPERPELLQVTDTVGPRFNTVLVATDGKKDDATGFWGVGVTDLNRGVGRFMGGSYRGLDRNLLRQEASPTAVRPPLVSYSPPMLPMQAQGHSLLVGKIPIHLR